MSDIYLQITETPTVVTLSAPVVSGALASTVTVANTVTVALDSNSLSALENVTVTVGAAITGTVTVSNFPATQPVSIASVTVGNSLTISSLPAISGTVTANINDPTDLLFADQIVDALFGSDQLLTALTNLPISGTVTIGSALPAGTNRIGVVTIGAGTVTIGAGTAQIGSVTASISGIVPISISSVTIGNTVTIAGTVTANPTGTQTIAGSVTLGASTAQIGSVTASVSKLNDLTSDGGGAQPSYGIQLGFSTETSPGDDYVLVAPSNPLPISGTVTVGNSVTIASLPAISGTVTANTFALQGTAVTTSNFTSTTASTVLANFNATREVLTIFNEGAGNLHICAGATCTTIAYQVRLSAGDYYEVPNHQTTITHSAVFATAGTARVTEVS